MAERMGRVGRGGGDADAPRLARADLDARADYPVGRGLTGPLTLVVGGLIVYLAWCVLWEQDHPASSAARKIHKGDAAARLDAIRELARVGPEDPEVALPALSDALTDPVPGNRLAAIEAVLMVIQGVGPNGSCPEEVGVAVMALMGLLPDSQPAIRARTVQALWLVVLIWQGTPRAIAVERVVAAMVDRAEEDDPEIRSAAVRGLGVVGHRLSDDPPARLVAALDDTSEAVRTAAAQGVATYRRGLARLIPTLVKAVETTRPECRPMYFRILEEVRPDLDDAPPLDELIPALVTAVGSRDPEAAGHAATMLGELGPAAREAAPAILEALRRSRVRGWDRNTAAMVDALGRLAPGSPEEDRALAILVEFLKLESNSQFAEELIDAVARFGPRASAALPSLRAMTASRSPEIREAARKAVAVIEESDR